MSLSPILKQLDFLFDIVFLAPEFNLLENPLFVLIVLLVLCFKHSVVASSAGVEAVSLAP